MTLYFISLGLWDERDMSLKALDAAKRCDFLFLETYTQPMNTSKEKLERLIGKKIVQLKRKDLEEDYGKLLELARKNDVGILVGGDAFSATTHIMLYIEAIKNGVKARVIHGSSIFSAIAECGLHLYKFGATATVPLPDRVSGLPMSVYEVIKKNKKNGFHTLLLLDVDLEKKRFLKPSEAIRIMLSVEKEVGEEVFKEDDKIIVASKIGSEDKKIVYGKVKELAKEEFEVPAVIIVPGSLHFTEEECLKVLNSLSGKS